MNYIRFLPRPASFRLYQYSSHADTYPAMHLLQNPPGITHPSLPHLCLLVFEAVLEVVCVSLPGYIIARLGHFDTEKQKFLANLNLMLFTPCLIFIKLASQLNADKLSELAIIPVIFVVQTFVSYLVSTLVAKAFGFSRRASNFVTAMGVFGNSNSLPISLVLSLSQTIKGLHWDRIPGDNDDEVGARGILYLLIFQQLGQLVRWSWGYHVLLAPKDKYPEYQEQVAEEGRYRDDVDDVDEAQQQVGPLINDLEGDTEDEDEDENEHRSFDSRTYVPAGRTPVAAASRASMTDSSDDEVGPKKRKPTGDDAATARHAVIKPHPHETDSTFPNALHSPASDANPTDAAPPSWVRRKSASLKARLSDSFLRFYQRMPRPCRRLLSSLQWAGRRAGCFIWDFMNPPLWAMLIAITVASIPSLQQLFFEEGTFVNNSVTNAIRSTAGVAVPLILVVLGANLANNTVARDDNHDPEEERIGTKLLVASLLSRMMLPTLIMAPILAVAAKFLPISILDDPIFIVVCFILTGAPSALQLAQICQINLVYEKTMGRILFQSYVIWILPSTLILVMLALEVVHWAAA